MVEHWYGKNHSEVPAKQSNLGHGRYLRHLAVKISPVNPKSALNHTIHKAYRVPKHPAKLSIMEIGVSPQD
jgi:hypothetical protein